MLSEILDIEVEALIYKGTFSFNRTIVKGGRATKVERKGS